MQATALMQVTKLQQRYTKNNDSVWSARLKEMRAKKDGSGEYCALNCKASIWLNELPFGEDDLIVVTGDLGQTDINNSGLENFLNKLHYYGFSNFIDFIELDSDDVVRHPAVKEILDIYENKL